VAGTKGASHFEDDLMRKALLSLAIGAIVTITGAAQSTTASRPYDAAREKRLGWFRDVKYGMFIHWGLYAIPAGEWNGKRSLGIGEWIQHRLKIPVREYEQLTKQFNPTKYNPDEWVQLAQDAGMKYIVITSKHHDGFALFKSAVSRYNIADATPYKKDILKQLAEACARRGMRLGFYYSQSQDWYEKDGAGNTWDFGADTDANGKELKNYDAYLRGKAEPQVKELLTNYGPVALIWFDTPRNMQGPIDPARHADRRPARDRGGLSIHRRQCHPARAVHRSVGDAGDDQSHLGLPKRRHGLEAARRDHLQARGHRQQRRQLPAERRADRGRRHPAGQSGHPAHGRTVAEGQRRGGLRGRDLAVRRGVR
jgi:hypothetical protein